MLAALTTVNEGSPAWLTVAFTDKTGASAAPTSVRYRVDCATTGAAVRAWTAVSAGASIEIALTSDDNAMQSAANEQEIREVTVEATYGAGDVLNAAYSYNVQNLRFA